ncbi:hypothetical protein NLX83_22275 [Allokutzneria sp. A3M-2-11 16]|uniref:hypothetical protein n=1 Tax=Allokutzneria sp. A3M-2-11 16 TaxID=2962043 RepID=UPI0020B7E4AB|nr:hypothetical protein [Allokutzneria sp. A3M-2-11 16]MCP3801996.1 hypothetical protein [Allokutzneria sp. A3M-2-11 16]
MQVGGSVSRALLIGVENVVGSIAPRPDTVRRCVSEVIAAPHGGGALDHVAAFAELGVDVLTVEPGQDAADRALLTRARELATARCHEFVVASARHDGLLGR